MSSLLEEATTLRGADGELTISVPDRWQQGRGAFGGIALGALARALIHGEPDPARRLRTFTADLCRPLMPGEAQVRVEVLRRGKQLSNIEARLLQGGEVVARGSGSLSVVRDASAPVVRPPAPAPTNWRDAPAVPVGPPMAPVFAQHLEYRPTGPLPFSAGPDPVAEGWIREREPPTRYDAPMLIAMLDVWWPSLFALLDAPLRVATTTFTAELHTDPSAVPPTDPLYHRARVETQSEGFMLEYRELWSGDRLLATNQQTMVLL